MYPFLHVFVVTQSLKTEKRGEFAGAAAIDIRLKSLQTHFYIHMDSHNIWFFGKREDAGDVSIVHIYKKRPFG